MLCLWDRESNRQGRAGRESCDMFAFTFLIQSGIACTHFVRWAIPPLYFRRFRLTYHNVTLKPAQSPSLSRWTFQCKDQTCNALGVLCTWPNSLNRPVVEVLEGKYFIAEAISAEFIANCIVAAHPPSSHGVCCSSCRASWIDSHVYPCWFQNGSKSSAWSDQDRGYTCTTGL